ncbi:MAG: hypothetical protein IJ662_11335 [Clostridia bacterium]|nr:hypothetical protein [Clostridia bacterium]
MLKYCEPCGYLYEQDRCPLCGSRKGRPPQGEDPCFVVEKGQMECDMLVDILKQNGIPSLVKGRSGAGLAMYTGLLMENYRLYVPYALYQEAKELTDAILNGEIIPEEWDETEEESEEGSDRE